MRVFTWCLAAATALAGCGGLVGDGSPSRSATTASAAAEGRLRGTAPGASAGGQVFLVRASAANEPRDLLALAQDVIAVTEVDPAGRFELPAPDEPADLILSAPGRALTRVRVEGAGALAVPTAAEGTARLDVVRDDTGQTEAYALCLVLGPDGEPLPLPTLDLVSRGDGSLTVTRLPAGDLTLLLASADGERHGQVAVSLDPGADARFDVRLGPAPDLADRFRQAVGGSAARIPGALGHEEEL